MENDLKLALRNAGISNKEAAAYIGKSYSTLIQYLNCFTPIPYEVKTKLRRLIDEKKRGKNEAATDEQ